MIKQRCGFTKCKWCKRVQRTYAKVGNRIRCKFESCDRTFKVKLKLSKIDKKYKNDFVVIPASELPEIKTRNV